MCVFDHGCDGIAIRVVRHNHFDGVGLEILCLFNLLAQGLAIEVSGTWRALFNEREKKLGNKNKTSSKQLGKSTSSFLTSRPQMPHEILLP